MSETVTRELAFAGARATESEVQRLIKQLGSPELAITPNQAGELIRYLQACRDGMTDFRQQAEKDASEFHMMAMLARQHELEEAIQFVDNGIVQPRWQGRGKQALEAADWLCVTGFRRLVAETNAPIGPLVAMDARRSPGVWEPGVSLPLPSLFQTKPELIRRSKDTTSSGLAWFPLVCLPSNLARTPEFYPLLSHEVGHAVDNYNGISHAILTEELADDPFHAYWQAWMREIVADAIGLALSGEAFATALEHFVAFIQVSTAISTGRRYPGIRLRLTMLADAITALGRSESKVAQRLRPDKTPRGKEAQLGEHFQTTLWPVLYKYCFRLLDDKRNPISEPAEAWVKEQEVIETEAETLVQCLDDSANTQIVWPETLDFRLAPSVVAAAVQQGSAVQKGKPFDTLDVFQRYHRTTIDNDRRPTWVAHPSSWSFPSKVLSTLRPTLLATDGQTKIPPLELLQRHKRIAFVGTTNDTLPAILAEAWETRRQPFGELEFFFASNGVLRQIERYEDRDASQPRLSIETLIAQREQAIKEILELLGRQIAGKWCLYLFRKLVPFGAYWDWDQPGGRIHVSAQLLGNDIKVCPASDHVWFDESPSVNYERYCTHLDRLRESATVLHRGGLERVN